jgi:hypothetical protein
LPVAELRKQLGDRRKKFRISPQQGLPKQDADEAQQESAPNDAERDY